MELATELDKLVSEGYLDEVPEVTPSGYIRYSYYVTAKGKKLLMEMEDRKILSSELENVTEQVSRKYGSLPLADLVEEAYSQF